MISWILFLSYCIIFSLGYLQSIDTHVYQFLSSFQNSSLTIYMKIITFFGSTLGIILVCLLCLINDWKIGFMMSIHVAIVAIINQIMKILIARPRPDVLPLVIERGFSFPSAHAMVSFILYGMIAYFFWNKKKIISAMLTVAMLASSAVSALAAEVGESLKVGDYTESAAETQKLIDSRPDIQRPMENLNRGAVAVRMDGYTYISWRWLGTESADTRYNIYRSLTEMSSYGQKINNEPLNATNFTDLFIASDDTQYFIVPVVNGEEQWDKVGAVQLWDNNYMDIPIQKPENNKVNGEEYSYTPGDASVGDLDGDGEYEIVLKWDPSNAKDAAQAGFTGECILDAYKLDGTRLWRINMGPNIRAGAHDTQFMVYDYDCDGKPKLLAVRLTAQSQVTALLSVTQTKTMPL